MRKKIWLFLIVWLLCLVAGCESKPRQIIRFDKFVIFSVLPFVQDTDGKFSHVDASFSPYYIPVVETGYTGFTPTLLIKTLPVNLTSTIAWIVDINRVQLQATIPGIVLQEPQENNFFCKSQYVSWSILVFDIPDAQDGDFFYMTQRFFLYNQNAYSVSFSTKDEDQRSTMIDDFSQAGCVTK